MIICERATSKLEGSKYPNIRYLPDTLGTVFSTEPLDKSLSGVGFFGGDDAEPRIDLLRARRLRGRPMRHCLLRLEASRQGGVFNFTNNNNIAVISYSGTGNNTSNRNRICDGRTSSTSQNDSEIAKELQ